MDVDPVAASRRDKVRVTILMLGLVTVGVAGYVGFVSVVDRGVGGATMVLAAATGFAAYFSPCSFPLLLTFLARRSEESPRQAFFATLRMGLGATVFLGLVALAMVALGSGVGAVVAFDSAFGRAFRAIVGMFLIVLGLRHARILTLRLAWIDHIADAAARKLDPGSMGSRTRSDLLYGFGYLLAGFG